jgi:hypothetical protein
MTNIVERCKAIYPQELPRSFRDAIKIARLWGINYLWIYSLCIIQDSKHDWFHAANIMIKVYQYDFINIAATGAAKSSEGCFRERNQRAVQPTEISVNGSIAKKVKAAGIMSYLSLIFGPKIGQ